MPKDMKPEKYAYRLNRMWLEDYIESDYAAPTGITIRGVGGPVVIEHRDLQNLKVLIDHYEGNRNAAVKEEATVWSKQFGDIFVKAYWDYGDEPYDEPVMEYSVSGFICNSDTPDDLREFADWLERELEDM